MGIDINESNVVKEYYEGKIYYNYYKIVAEEKEHEVYLYSWIHCYERNYTRTATEAVYPAIITLNKVNYDYTF